MGEKYQALVSRLAEIRNINRALAVLSWDQQVNMPPGGAQARAAQIGTLTRIEHEMLISDETARLLEDAAQRDRRARITTRTKPAWCASCSRTCSEQTCLPTELVAQIRRAGSDRASGVGAGARQQRFRRVRADAGTDPRPQARGGRAHGLHRTSLRRPAQRVRARHDRQPRQAVVRRAQARSGRADRRDHASAATRSTIRCCTSRSTSRSSARSARWSSKPTATTSIAGGRTKRCIPSAPPSRRATCASRRASRPISSTRRCSARCTKPGHAMYEQGVDPSLEGTPLSRGTSLGVHELQSRMWENFVGRSKGFWKWAFPQLQATFPDQLERRRCSTRSTGRSTRCSRRTSASKPTKRPTTCTSCCASNWKWRWSPGTSKSPTCTKNGTTASRRSSASRRRATSSACCKTSTGRAG